MSLSRSGQAAGAAHSTSNTHVTGGASAAGHMGILATNGEKIKANKYAQGTEGTAVPSGAAANPISSTTGYTYSPSSTFQMAGNEQIQDRNQYKFMYVAMNPNNEKYQMEHEEARLREEHLQQLNQQRMNSGSYGYYQNKGGQKGADGATQPGSSGDVPSTTAMSASMKQRNASSNNSQTGTAGVADSSYRQIFQNFQGGATATSGSTDGTQTSQKNATGSASQATKPGGSATGSGAGQQAATSGTTPTQGGNQKMSALDRLKQVQNLFKQTWNGIHTEYTGRPGTSNICNKKRHFAKPDQMAYEEERSETLDRLFTLLRSIENDGIPLVVPSAHDRQSRTAQNFFNKNRTFDVAQAPLLQYVQMNKSKGGINENVDFKGIDRSQLLMNAPPTSTYGHHQGKGGYHIDNCELLYKILKGDTKLVRSLCEANGFTYTESHEWNLLWASSSCKAYLYEGLNEYQRLNHFPHSYEITRKDRLCFNYVKAQEKFGRDAFDFMPDTYILPNEYGDLLSHYQKLKQTDPRRNVWIVKPSNSSRGRGIHIIDDINDLNVDELSIISRYVTNPLLINGYKFDLRIYVVVTCYEPLRLYVYKEGLARFASETYTAKFNKNNKYMHLTNYSVNKKNENFVQNETSEHDDFGFKWSLSAFCKHLETVGINMSLLWSRIFDVVIKTMACGENYVIQAQKKNQMHRGNCFEVFGFDILLDSDLKPWLVEVNLSPSLSSDSPLDHTIKSTLLVDTFNMIQLKRFDRKKESLNKIKYRSKGNPNIAGSQANQKHKGYKLDSSLCGQIQIPPTGANEVFMGGYQINPQVNQIIDRILEEFPDQFSNNEEAIRKSCLLKFRDVVHETVQEYNRSGEFIRIFPCKGSKPYEKYFSGVFGTRMLNRIVHKVLFTNELLPYEKGPKFSQMLSDGDKKLKTADPNKNLKYEIEGVPQEQSYDHYKNRVLQKKKSDKRQEELEAYKQETKATGAVLESKQSKESLPDSDADPDGDSDTNPAQNAGSRSRPKETQLEDKTALDKAVDLQKQNAAKLRSTSTSNAKSTGIEELQRKSRSNNKNPQAKPGERSGERPVALPKRSAMGNQGGHSNSPTHLRTSEGDNAGAASRVPVSGNSTKSSQQTRDSTNRVTGTPSAAQNQGQASVNNHQKIMITGDDILIEYVTRLMKMFSTNKIREEELSTEQQTKIEKFITHYVWYAQDKSGKNAKPGSQTASQPQTQGSLKARLENRLNEMLERRRRLLKMLFKNEGRLQTFHEQYPDIVKRKKEVIEKFDSKELEHLLSNSTKNVAQEVVGCLIPSKGKGILNEIEVIMGTQKQIR